MPPMPGSFPLQPTLGWLLFAALAIFGFVFVKEGEYRLPRRPGLARIACQVLYAVGGVSVVTVFFLLMDSGFPIAPLAFARTWLFNALTLFALGLVWRLISHGVPLLLRGPIWLALYAWYSAKRRLEARRLRITNPPAT
jgi:hypothetical protein